MQTAEAIIEVRWDTVTGILLSHLSGLIGVEEVRRWQAMLAVELAGIPDVGRFKLLSNLQGYEPASLDAHKEFRNVIPETLMQYGFRPAFLDLFGVKDVEIRATRGVICAAVAHVHHDAEKMNGYRQDLGRPNEQFFTDVSQAEVWLREQAGSGR
jgi:hypothetical protein